jgi:transposase InsO family protein
LQKFALGARWAQLAAVNLFLAVVLDACSRRSVGWAMATHLKTDLVLGRGASRRLPLPRGLVQPAPPTLRARSAVPGQL